jgi:ATP-dependent DNA ligase
MGRSPPMQRHQAILNLVTQLNHAILRVLPASSGRLRYTDHVLDRGLDLFAALEAQKLEGMTAKRADSLYIEGRSKDWLKVKTRAGIAQMQKRIESWGHR